MADRQSIVSLVRASVVDVILGADVFDCVKAWMNSFPESRVSMSIFVG
jgi:hypothetical protein